MANGATWRAWRRGTPTSSTRITATSWNHWRSCADRRLMHRQKLPALRCRPVIRNPSTSRENTRWVEKAHERTFEGKKRQLRVITTTQYIKRFGVFWGAGRGGAFYLLPERYIYIQIYIFYFYLRYFCSCAKRYKSSLSWLTDTLCRQKGARRTFA